MSKEIFWGVKLFSLSYAYILLLLFLFILCYAMAEKAICYAPGKIKVITIILSIFMILKCGSLIIMSLKDNMQYIYCLKYFTFMDIIYIPVLAFLCIYIFYRNEKVKLNFVFIPMIMAGIIYYFAVIRATGVITLSDVAGYIIEINSFWYVNIFYLIFNTFIIVLAVRMYQCNHSIKPGSLFLIFSSAVSLILCIIVRINFDIKAMCIISDMIWCICYIYALQKLKK